MHKEYARCEDQFHQSESDIFFYHLCMADPANASLAIRAQRFAGFYLNEDPEAINYDPEHRIILSPFNGSDGARQNAGMNRASPLFHNRSVSVPRRRGDEPQRSSAALDSEDRSPQARG